MKNIIRYSSVIIGSYCAWWFINFFLSSYTSLSALHHRDGFQTFNFVNPLAWIVAVVLVSVYAFRCQEKKNELGLLWYMVVLFLFALLIGLTNTILTFIIGIVGGARSLIDNSGPGIINLFVDSYIRSFAKETLVGLFLSISLWLIIRLLRKIFDYDYDAIVINKHFFSSLVRWRVFHIAVLLFVLVMFAGYSFTTVKLHGLVVNENCQPIPEAKIVASYHPWQLPFSVPQKISERESFNFLKKTEVETDSQGRFVFDLEATHFLIEEVRYRREYSNIYDFPNEREYTPAIVTGDTAWYTNNYSNYIVDGSHRNSYDDPIIFYGVLKQKRHNQDVMVNRESIAKRNNIYLPIDNGYSAFIPLFDSKQYDGVIPTEPPKGLHIRYNLQTESIEITGEVVETKGENGRYNPWERGSRINDVLKIYVDSSNKYNRQKINRSFYFSTLKEGVYGETHLSYAQIVFMQDASGNKVNGLKLSFSEGIVSFASLKNHEKIEYKFDKKHCLPEQ